MIAPMGDSDNWSGIQGATDMPHPVGWVEDEESGAGKGEWDRESRHHSPETPSIKDFGLEGPSPDPNRPQRAFFHYRADFSHDVEGDSTVESVNCSGDQSVGLAGAGEISVSRTPKFSAMTTTSPRA